MNSIKLTIMACCMAIASASAMPQIDAPTFHVPTSHKKAPRQLSKVSRNMLAAVRVISNAIYLSNPKNFNISSVFAATWGIVDLTEIIESVAGEDTDNDDLTEISPEEQVAINNKATALKGTLLPVITTVLPALSAWYTCQGEHEKALTLQSLSSLARTALKYIDCPKSLEKRLYGALLALHVMATIYAIHNAKALTTVETPPTTGQGQGATQPEAPGDAAKKAGEKGKDKQPAAGSSEQPSTAAAASATAEPGIVAIRLPSENQSNVTHGDNERPVAVFRMSEEEIVRLILRGLPSQYITREASPSRPCAPTTTSSSATPSTTTTHGSTASPSAVTPVATSITTAAAPTTSSTPVSAPASVATSTTSAAPIVAVPVSAALSTPAAAAITESVDLS